MHIVSDYQYCSSHYVLTDRVSSSAILRCGSPFVWASNVNCKLYARMHQRTTVNIMNIATRKKFLRHISFSYL